MFFAEDRIMAASDDCGGFSGAASGSIMQIGPCRKMIWEIFRIMGSPVTIRLLDLPLHNFCLEELQSAYWQPICVSSTEVVRQRVETLHEPNLLGIMLPLGITTLTSIICRYRPLGGYL
jgi:hypothetical protein